MEPENQLKSILQKVADEQEYEDIKFKQIYSGGANCTSFLYQATISAPNKADLHLFVKVAAVGEKLRSAAPFRIFTIETFFYQKVKQVYQDLEERYKVPIQHKMVIPKCYAANDEIYKETLVLEDLTVAGYQSFNRFKSITWEYASKSVQNLAKLHALSIAWSIYDPEAFEEASNLLNQEHSVTAIMGYFQSTVKKVLEVTNEQNKERLEKFTDDILKDTDFFKYSKPMRRPVIAYADYKPSNVMHKQNEDGTIDIVSVDYQTLQIGNPMVDVMYFILNGSDKTFRKEHFKRTVEHYYGELRAALRRLAIDPDAVYSREDFDFEFQQILPFSLILSIFSLLIVTVDAKDAPKVNEVTEIEDFAVSPSSLYIERINDIIDDYIDMGIL